MEIVSGEIHGQILKGLKKVAGEKTRVILEDERKVAASYAHLLLPLSARAGLNNRIFPELGEHPCGRNCGGEVTRRASNVLLSNSREMCTAFSSPCAGQTWMSN